ncbi:peptidoglycan recognition protein family protein [Sanguibacter inulinus]|uniref:N-acetylmuramoyl-L-alanine amidase n=1 Tax=Sanguibacter inulinus TaxID=60922 RepID=A0A853ES18_9MICO|nr:peptidoglycan recognition family protein [Sanguibacter inulinus]MBF0721387.1 N-acetylmuramoyl-L-alanine amidase [Sanguibacter inulinus]NYS92532.1 N-acetylmuramoyl-L-alanine amidase [Sanguibacter inulinus]
MTYESITDRNSGNFTPAGAVQKVFGRPRVIKSITIHHWGVYGQRFAGVVDYLCRPGGKSSAHYIVEDGRVACIVAPRDAAWHSGSDAGNATSVGLELRPEATDGDYATAAELIRELRAAFGDLPLVRHSSWKATACPGKWDLDRLDRLARSSGASGGGTKPAAPPVPAPVKPTPARTTNPAGRPLLDLDGFLGSATISELQHVLGTTVDGIISTGPDGSQLVAELQLYLLSKGHELGKVDGQGLYPNTHGRTIKTRTQVALQRYLGTTPDGVLDAPSAAIEALQRRLNAGTF